MKRLSWILVFSLCACSSSDRQTCEPGMQLVCDCPGGLKGVQACLEDGSGWGECDCPCDKDCADRDCGPDPVCGESCGTCGADQTCSGAGRCECDYISCGGACCAQDQVCFQNACCTPDCGTRVCGFDPVCGVSCGQCDPGDDCTPDGRCIPGGTNPEISVCIKDCLGDQSGASCLAAQEVCSESAAPQSLVVRYGDADLDTQVNREVVVRNPGNGPLLVTGLSLLGGDLNQFILSSPDLPGTLAAGAEAVVSVVYDPGTGGAHSSALQILSDDSDESEIRVELEGRALAPRVCPDPLIVDFGNVQTGQSKEMTFNLKNCGLSDLSLMGVSLNPGSSSDFDLLNLPTLPQTLPPDASLDIQVRYSPPSLGSDNGGVDIYSDDPASDPATHLTGTVTLTGSSSSQVCDMVATPFAVNFGGVVTGGSDTIDLHLSNFGTDTCTFHDAQITQNSTDSEFSIVSAPSPNTSFDPGDTLHIGLSYGPVNLGMDTGTLTVSGSDPEGDILINLSGEGVATAECDLQVIPMDVQFGTVSPGRTAVNAISLSNTGNGPCAVTNLELRPSVMFHSDFSFLSLPVLPLVINRSGQPGSTVVLDVVFAPLDTGLHRATVWITSDDPDLQQSGGFDCNPPPQPGQACVPLHGLSEESSVEVIPTELDFGVVAVGCNSPDRDITVYNLGSMPLNVTGIQLEDPQDPNFEIVSAPVVPYQLPGGGDFEIRLRYHPQDTNPHRSTLYIVTDDPGVDLLAVPLLGQGTNISDHTDVFFQHTDVKSDVLFVVDNSGSMSWAQDGMASGFPYFISRAIALDADFHIGVIATEVNEAETGVGNPSRDIYPGVLVQAPGRPKIITPSTPDLEQAFSDNARLGECCSDEQEAGLQAAWMALSEPLVDDPAANAGFLREDAKLYIICLSNEQDQSLGDPGFFENFFESLKGSVNTEWMKLSAICGDAPNGCTAAGGTADSGTRYIEVANRTGGIFESICTTDWQQTMENLAVDAFSTVREFPLSRPADPATIAVTVEGSTVPQATCAGCPNGWTYYPDTNSIYFGDDVVPAPGSQIQVSYTAACL